MKKIAGLALCLCLSACGATVIRPQAPEHADWKTLRVKVDPPDPDRAEALRAELDGTHLFGTVALPAQFAQDDRTPDLIVSRVDEKVMGRTHGPFCFAYALSYLTLGLVPEVCDQRYQVRIDLTAPATGRADQLTVELVQRRVMGWYGALSSLFGDWRFFGPGPGDPPLARAALLTERAKIDALLAH
ncbi:MAG: hypothetical protein QJR02_00010 [Sinobacteraceae bacterium]|nr:hypothetical protein [Nevskiaceae bacterium]